MQTATRAEALRHYVESHRDEMLGLLAELVEIESPTDHRAGTTIVADRLAEGLAELGFVVRRLKSERFGDHVVADGGADSGQRIFAIGHVDTVYPLGTGWGFSCGDERAYGPGVIDMKSGDVALLFALKALDATGGIPLPVRVCFNTDEEPGSPESGPLMEELVDGCAYALVLEPAEPTGEGVAERKGVGIFTVEVTGRSAHAGQEPEKGASAISELCAVVGAIEALARPEVGTTVNAGVVTGGTAAYVVPDRACAMIDVRVPDMDEQHRIEHELAAVCERQHVKGTTTVVSGGFHRSPMTRLEGSDRLYEAWSRAAEALGERISFVRSGAASDGNTIAACGVPVIDGLGPVGGRAHSRDEYMDVGTFFARTTLLAQAIDELAALC